jgi:hypothetical protein
VFNNVKGKVRFYTELPAANDALIIVPIETTGIETDATLKDYDDLSTLLAGTSNEQTTMGRKTVTSASATVDDTNDRVDVDMADIVWTAASGNAISALLVCYDPDTTTGTDSTVVPLVKLDCVLTPDTTDFTAQIAAAGFYRAA